MREVKFRAWDRDLCKWVSPNVHLDYSGLLFWSLGGQEDILVANLTRPAIDINLYTGLKDMCGKEIYEADIVDENGIGFIVYKDCGFFIQWNKNAWDCLTAECKVIGNIYEHPELLKEVIHERD